MYGQHAPPIDLVGHSSGAGMRVSIALATCQGEKFLRRQLDSILNQSLLPYELVIGDDASTDGTVAMIEHFALSAPFPVRLTRNPRRLGFRENFMQTALRCSGDVIAFCDQDDVWYSEKLARCVFPFVDPEVTLVCHDANVVNALGQKVEKSIVVRRNGVWSPSHRPLHSQYGLTMVIRRALIEHYDLWLQTIDENTSDRTQHAAHDPWFYFLAANLGKIVNIDEPLVDYFQHEANTIGIPHGFVTRTLQYRSEYYQLRVQAVSIRIAILRELQNRATAKYRAHITQQFSIYHRHLKIYEARALIYSDEPLAARCIGLAKALAAGGYGQQGFGLRALVADLVYGIIRFSPGPKLYAMLQRS